MRPFLALALGALLTTVVGVSSASAGLVEFGVVPGLTLVNHADHDSGLPSAETHAASNLGAATARLNGKVSPHSRPTTYHFDYGLTSDYGSRTGDTAAGRGEGGVSAVATIGGLQPATTYHFRLVADYDAGSVHGADKTFTTTGSAAPGDPGTTPSDPGTTPGDPGTTPGGGTTTPGGGTTTPGGGTTTPGGGTTDSGSGGQPDASNQLVIGGQAKKHKQFAVAPTAGRISVNLPGPSGFQPLVEGVSVPVGSIVDARKGTAAITTQLDSGRKQTAEFWGERFKVRQPSDEGGLTEIRVRDAVRACDGKSISARDKIGSARKKRRHGGLWGRDTRGRWRTHGRGSQATTRGTTWFTEERCDGTYTKVIKGSVKVRDHYLKRKIVLNAGESYLARPHWKHPHHVR